MSDTDSLHSSESIHSLDSQESYPVSQSFLYDHTESVWQTRQKQRQRRAMTAYYTPSVGRWDISVPRKPERSRGNRTYRAPPKR